MSTNKNIYRIAAASSDGKVINQHFGRADNFLIFEISGSRYSLIERRDVTPLCDNGEHTEEGLLSAIGALKDCTAVVVSKIGAPAKRALEINGISVFEQPDYINNALEKLTAYYTK